MNTNTKALVITASYAPKLEKRREERIHAALFDKHKVRVTELDWMGGAGDTDTEIEIYIDGNESHGRGDPQERATRLASDLRACGMAVTIERYGFV
jgi:hypothetical protein